MSEEKEKPETIEGKINSILKEINRCIETERLKPDWREDFFSGKQLNDLRDILEKKGFSIAKLFQQGRIEKKGNQWDLKRNKILLHALELLEEYELDLTTGAYFLGKLNQVINHFRERTQEEKK